MVETSAINLKGRRRTFLTGAALAGTAAAAGGIVGLGLPRAAAAQAITDADIANFALNLEYLEAEYYLRGAFGRGLRSSDIQGTGALGSVTGGRRVTFATPIVEEYAQEIANDEEAHVIFLRRTLGSAAAARPRIDFNQSFPALASAAGLGAGFDPFADELSFLLGAFVFEDVGVTAYNGAAPLIQSKAILGAAASILAVEAYHAGEIRTLLVGRDASTGTTDATDAARAISRLRDRLDGPGDKDQGPINNEGKVNIVPRDDDPRLGLAFTRTPQQVLNIVYAGGASRGRGGFFPNGLNGTLR